MAGFRDRAPKFRARPKPRPLAEWFHVTFDEESIHLDVSPPKSEPWTAHFPWSSIERIAFKAEELYTSDGIYFFTSLRPESFVVPTQADGGAELWAEVLRRGLFDAELAVEAAASVGGIFVWPPAGRGR
jgi:hypothetical protein